MEKETIKVLYNRVDNILANLSLKDWWNVNKNSPRAKNGKYTPTGKQRDWLPYSLSSETIEATEILKLIHEDMNKEDEEKVKAFIMKYRLLHPEYIDMIVYYTIIKL